MSRRRYSSNRDLNELARQYVCAGWRVFHTDGNHLKFVAPFGAVIIASSSPSDWRSFRNIRANLRRCERTSFGRSFERHALAS